MINSKKILLTFAVIWLATSTTMAQNYNNTYGFVTPYQSSANTCSYQVSNGRLVQGGTVQDPYSSGAPDVVELGQLNPINGMMIPNPFFYAYPSGFDHRAVDLIESVNNPNSVVVVSNIYNSGSNTFTIGVFKTNPASGAIFWSFELGTTLPNLEGRAITRDNNGNYYVLGHTSPAGSSNRMLYIASISEFGVMNWENVYPFNYSTEDFEAVDLIYNMANDLIVTANYNNPTPNGILVAQVDIGFGFMNVAKRVTLMGGTPDFVAHDIELINGNYVVVGEINGSMRRGFLLQYQPFLTPFVPFAQVYSASPADIYMTGVERSPGGNIYVSFDYVGTTIYPGIARLNFTGVPLLSNLHNVVGYIGSTGLIGVNGNNNYIIKGATNNSAFPGLPSLSMIGNSSALNIVPVLCNFPQPFINSDSAFEQVIQISSQNLTTYINMPLLVNNLNGTIYNCTGSPIGGFRLASTGIDEEELEGSVNVYPNPSNGYVTVEINEELMQQYQSAEVFNSLGEVVAVFPMNKPVEQLDLSNEAPGIYMLRMKTSDGNVSATKRIVVK